MGKCAVRGAARRGGRPVEAAGVPRRIFAVGPVQLVDGSRGDALRGRRNMFIGEHLHESRALSTDLDPRENFCMENSSPKTRTPLGDTAPPRRPASNVWIVLLIFGIIAVAIVTMQGAARSIISYSFFLEQVEAGNILQVKLGEQEATGLFREAPETQPRYDRDGKLIASDGKPLNRQFRVILPRDGESRGKLTMLLNDKKVLYENEPASNALLMFYLLLLLVPLILFGFFWFSFRRTRDQMMGGGFL